MDTQKVDKMKECLDLLKGLNEKFDSIMAELSKDESFAESQQWEDYLKWVKGK